MIINGKRALAYTARCGAIEKIEGADNIELMNVLGWKVITKIGEFKEGDLCVYFEIDSKLPEKEWSEFMAAKHYKVKTMKLGKFKVISQGLALPVNIFGIDIPNEEGIDVTELLGVTYAVEEDNIRKNKPNPDAKYNAMAARHKNIFKLKPVRWLMKRTWGRKLLFAIFGKKKDSPRGWPTHFPYIHKTDEERCENIPWVLKLTDPLVVTEKLDGTSCTYILEKKKKWLKTAYEFYVLSRNIRQQDENQKTYHDHNIYWDLAFKYDIENKLRRYLEEFPHLDYVCIQGEGVGNVQGNPLKLEEDDLYVFNFITSDIGRWPSTTAKIILGLRGFKFVPILDENYHMPDNMEDFKKYADGPSAVNPKVKREGVVIRNPIDDFSFKNVSREYLLKHNQ